MTTLNDQISMEEVKRYSLRRQLDAEGTRAYIRMLEEKCGYEVIDRENFGVHDSGSTDHEEEFPSTI